MYVTLIMEHVIVLMLESVEITVQYVIHYQLIRATLQTFVIVS